MLEHATGLNGCERAALNYLPIGADVIQTKWLQVDFPSLDRQHAFIISQVATG